MDILKIIFMLVICLIILYLLSILIFRYFHQTKSSRQKLNHLEQEISQDPDYSHAIIYMEAKAGDKSYYFGNQMTLETPYYIASITKLFTHSLVFQLIDQGKLSYQQRLDQVLKPEIWQKLLVKNGIDYSGQITVRQLIDQTSGLPDYETEKMPDGKIILKELRSEDFDLTDQAALDLTRQLRARHLPSDNKAYYSNLNAILLGMICQALTGQSLKDLMVQYIITPLNLSKTYVAEAPPETVPVYSHHRPLTIEKYAFSSIAPGGVVSTARDQMTFIKAFFEGGLFNPCHLQEVDYRSLQFIPLKYGSGTMMMEVSPIFSPYIPTKRIIGHSGSLGSFAFYSPSKDLYIVGSFNQVEHHPFQKIYQWLDAWE